MGQPRENMAPPPFVLSLSKDGAAVDFLRLSKDEPAAVKERARR
jgi:hypothetical protein